MAKSFLPKTNYTNIDLADYGGEGTIRVSAMTLKISQEITLDLQKLALADGYTAEDFQRKEAEINSKYMIPMMCLFIGKCSQIEDEGGYRSLTPLEIDELPPQLANDIYSAILEMNNFPLERNAGAGSKQERLKPTDAEL